MNLGDYCNVPNGGIRCVRPDEQEVRRRHQLRHRRNTNETRVSFYRTLNSEPGLTATHYYDTRLKSTQDPNKTWWIKGKKLFPSSTRIHTCISSHLYQTLGELFQTNYPKTFPHLQIPSPTSYYTRPLTRKARLSALSSNVALMQPLNPSSLNNPVLQSHIMSVWW